jgi:hypothetical protein
MLGPTTCTWWSWLPLGAPNRHGHEAAASALLCVWPPPPNRYTSPAPGALAPAAAIASVAPPQRHAMRCYVYQSEGSPCRRSCTFHLHGQGWHPVSLLIAASMTQQRRGAHRFAQLRRSNWRAVVVQQMRVQHGVHAAGLVAEEEINIAAAAGRTPPLVSRAHLPVGAFHMLIPSCTGSEHRQ